MVQSLLPKGQWHRDRRGDSGHGREREKEFIRFGVNSLDDSVIGQAVAMLRFVKGGAEKGGNGFFVNIPGQDKAVIFTAAHNLIDVDGTRTTKFRAWWQGADRWAQIEEKDTHISSVYSKTPTKDSAIDDFGIILVDRNSTPPPPTTAFGFALRLGEEDRIDGLCNVSSYLVSAQQGDKPTRSTGNFINPLLKEHQLEYLVPTEAGVSGSVVWVGYNGSPVAVAVHNYGPKRKSPKYGSLGSRINLKMMREILEWTGVYHRATKILAQPLGKKQAAPPHPLTLIWSDDDKIFRVHVQDDADPSDKPDESVFEALPVFSSAMLQGKEPRVEFGFAQPDHRTADKPGAVRWVSWNTEWGSAGMSSSLGRARPARLEKKGTSSTISLNYQGNVLDIVFRTDREVVDEWELKFPGSDFSGVAYQTRGTQDFQNPYTRFVLKDVEYQGP
uniref:Serine protease n=1 Tax=Bionectria ochroleuca TaxID=29856 RepID=A0A8H7TRZ2_BIOOC